MVQVDTARISEEEQDLDFQRELAEFQKRFDALENDQKQKFSLCVHEAGHMVYFRRLGWTIEKLHGPYIYRDADGTLRNVLGAVSPNRGEANDFIAAVKTDIGGFVLAEAITGEPDSDTAIKNDMRILTSIEAPEEAIETATNEIIEELNDDGFMWELIGTVQEYENAVFHTDETWLWGWREYRLDLPGQRFLVGHDQLNWLLIDDGELKLIADGKECPPDKAHELYFVGGGMHASKRAVDAVNRWNEMTKSKTSLRPAKAK